MQRRRDEMRSNSGKIREECLSISQILQRIMHKDAESVANLERLSEKEILSNTKRFLSVTKFQHSVMQKVTEIGIELEAFASEIATDDIDANSPNRSTFDETLKIDQESSDKAVKTDSSNLSIPGSSLKIVDETLESLKASLLDEARRIALIQIESDVPSSSDRSNEINEDTVVENKAVEPEPTNEIVDNSDETSSSSCYPDETDREVEAEKVSTDVTSGDDSSAKLKKAKSKAGKCKTSKLDAEIAKHDTKIVQSDKPRSVLDAIKDKKPLSRKDRLLQKIPKVSMPDLSFKPSARSLEASDSYLSCLGSGSTTSEDNVGEKRKNQSVVVQDIKNENFKVAHLTLQDPPDPTLGMVCLISHMVSPAEIYINPADDNVGLLDSNRSLTYQFAECYAKTKSPYATKEDVKACLGKYCLSYVDDWSSWYRTEIINWRLEETTDPDLVTVKLVDYGHVTDVDFRNLRELLYDFCHVPKYAIKCHLAHLYPPGSTLDALMEKWPAISLEHLYNITNNENGDCFKVTFVEKNGDSWAVELLSVHEANEHNSVGHQLLTLDGAVEILPDPTGVFRDNFLINQLKTAQGFSGILNMMTEEEKLDKFYENVENCEPNNLDEALTCYKASDEKRICQFAKDGTCFKGPKCKLEHGRLRKDGYTTDRQYVYTTSFNAIALPKSGDIFKLFVTSIVNVNTFYCNLVGKSSNYKDLKNLIKSMNEQCTVEKYNRLQITPACGELVIANRLNDHWYRAQVLDNYHFPDRNEATIQVFLVDLGETIDVTMSELRQIEPVYLSLPFQAILCKLSNVRPNEGDESNKEAKLYCEYRFLCQMLKAKVIYSSHTYLEVLMAKKNGDDIGEQIIADGHGLLKTDSYAPKCIENILID